MKHYVLSVVFLFVCVSSTVADYEPYTQWDLPDGAIARLGKGSIRDIAYSPDGSRLAVGGGPGIWIYDADTGAEVALLEGHTGIVLGIAYSPDSTTLASGNRDGTVRLWDVATATLLNTLEHTGTISVAFSLDGTTIASGSLDTTVRLWDAATGSVLNTLEGHTDLVYSVAFSPDGSTLASASSDDTVRLWDVATATLLNTLEHTRVSSIAYSPDGTTIASGSWDTTVRLWDAATGTLKNTLEHTGSIYSVAFSPDSATIASGLGVGERCIYGMRCLAPSKIRLNTPALSIVSPLVQMALHSQGQVTERYNSGMWRLAYSSTLSQNTPRLSIASPLVPMAAHSQVQVRTAPCCYGTHTQGPY